MVTGNTPVQGFGPKRRLRRRAEFLTVQDGGRRVAGRCYLLFALRRAPSAAGADARLGVTVSKRVGEAVVRNRVKRWLRESYRRSAFLAPPRTDLVVVARPQAAQSSYEETNEELRGLLKRLGR